MSMTAKQIQEKLINEVQVQIFKQGKIVYCVAEKESDSSLFSNKRLLIFNTIERYIGYSNNLPTLIPFGDSSTVPVPKKRTRFEALRYSKVKGKDNRIEMICSGVQFKGKLIKQTWLFIFKTNDMANRFIYELDQFKKELQKPPVVIQSQVENIHQVIKPYNQPRQSYNQPPKNQQPQINNTNVNTNQKQRSYVYQNVIVQQNNTKINKSELPIYQPQTPINTLNSPHNSKKQSLEKQMYQQKSSKMENYNNISNFSNKQSQENDYQRQFERIVSNNNLKKESKESFHYEEPIQVNQNVESRKSGVKQVSGYQQQNTRNQANKYGLKQKLSKASIIQPNEFDWNFQFYFSQNPLQTLIQFTHNSETIIKQIIDEFNLPENFRQQQPLESSNLHCVYKIQGLLIKIAYSTEYANNQPFFVDDRYLNAIKNQFNNYNYFIASTSNKGLFRVPLCSLVEYKGYTALVKAIVKNGRQIPSANLTTQLQKLQKILRIKKQIFNSKENVTLIYVSVDNQGQVQSEIVYVDDLSYLLPIDITATEEDSQFLPEILLSSGNNAGYIYNGQKVRLDKKPDKFTQRQIVQLQDLSKNVKLNCDKFILQVDNLDIIILNHIDMYREMNKLGISHCYLNYLYKLSQVQLFKKYFLSEMAANICLSLFKNHVQTQIKQIAAKKIPKVKQFQIQEVILQGVYNFISDLLSDTEHSPHLWKVIMSEVKKKYNVVGTKEEIAFGYFISSFLSRSNLKLNFELFNQSTNIPKEFIEGFNVSSQSYFPRFVTKFNSVLQILKEQPSETGFDNLVEILELKDQRIPQFCRTFKIEDSLSIYLGNFISADIDKEMVNEFRHLQMYEFIKKLPPTLTSIKLSLMAIKWAIKRKQQKIAIEIFQTSSELITFWGGQFHPLLGEFYDFFSLYYVINGEFEEAITLGKSSLVNTIKIVGSSNLSTAEKYYQLGNIFFKIGKKDQALSHYIKTRDILASNKKTTIPEYAVISLKLALLYLNFGKIPDAIDLSYECLKIFQKQTNHQQQLLQTYQILSRAYEITQKKNEALDVAALCCQQLNNTDDPKIMERMLKIGLFPHLQSVPSTVAKVLLNIMQNLPFSRQSSQYTQAFNYLNRRAKNQNISQIFIAYIEKLDKLSYEINSKDLIRKHKSFENDTKTEAQDFLVLLQAVTQLIDESYLIGILKQYQY